MVEHFLFLELRDRDFTAFYEDAVGIVMGRLPEKPPHLTVRGPYRRSLKQEQLSRWRDQMRFAVLEVTGLGHFDNPNEQVVYLHVDSPQLREIWWKPDYPIARFGFNPHVSIYRGSDRALATRLLTFPPLRDLRVLVAEFELVPFVRSKGGQRELSLDAVQRATDHGRFMESHAIPPDFFRRLIDVSRISDPPGAVNSEAT